MAEDYFAILGGGESSTGNNASVYAKRAGPIVAILRSPADAISADKLLSSLHYSYSIRWIYEKRNSTKILWGIPVRILGTVVKSLFFITLLGVISVIAGAAFAVLRFALQSRSYKHMTDEPDQTEIIRLRLR